MLKQYIWFAGGLFVLSVMLFSTGASARPRIILGFTGCKAGEIRVGPSPTNTVSLSSSRCYRDGRPILTLVRYSYKQTDYGGADCGTQLNNRPGPNFIPRVKNTFFVWVNFTVMPKYKSSGARPKSTGWQKLILGHWQLQCGRSYAGAEPNPASICDDTAVALVAQYDPKQLGNLPCGIAIRDDYQFFGWLPRYTSRPVIIGNTVYSPPLATPGSDCKAYPQGARRFKWMGFPIRFENYRCGEMGVSSQPFVYYLPPNSTQLCHDSIWPKYRDVYYSVGSYNLPYSVVSHFQLPDDWRNWGGRLVIAYKGLFFKWPGYNNKDAGHEFSVSEIKLTGTADGCAELTSFVY